MARVSLFILSLVLLFAPLTSGFVNPDDPWYQTDKLDPTPEGDAFGSTVALNGGTMVVGHPYLHGVGAVTVYERTGGDWTQVAQFNGTKDNSRFGSAIALDGDTFVTNAPGYTHGLGGQFPISCVDTTAKLYVHERVDGVWKKTATLSPDVDVPRLSCVGGERSDRSLVLDDGLLVVGEPWTSNDVFVYERQPNGTWSNTAVITWEGGSEFRSFGRSVDLSKEAGRIIVGHPSSGGDPAVHVYDRGSEGWERTATLQGCCDWTGDIAVLSEDGDTIAAAGSAWSEPSKVHIWEDDGDGWTKILERAPEDHHDSRPWISDLSLAGDTLAVGAWVDDTYPALTQETREKVPPLQFLVFRDIFSFEKYVSPYGNGATYVFRANETGQWQQTAKVMPTEEFGINFFGWDVSLDDQQLVVGAPRDHGSPTDPGYYDSGPTGAVYVFEEGRLGASVLSYS